VLIAALDDQLAQLAPPPGQRRWSEVLQAAHGRRFRHESFQLFSAGLGQGIPWRPFLQVTQALKKLACEAAPIHQRRGKLMAKLRRQQQQTFGARVGERLAQSACDRVGERRVRLDACLEAQMTAGSNCQIEC
jgi:hypothetical protein